MKLWIARDRDGFLGLYDDFPEMHAGYFVCQPGKDVLELNRKLFPELTFENSPQEVELKIVKK